VKFKLPRRCKNLEGPWFSGPPWLRPCTCGLYNVGYVQCKCFM